MSIVRRFGVLALGVLLLAAGIWRLAVAEAQAPTFGWTAYAPLTSTTFSPVGWPYLPFLVIGIGAVLVAGWFGYQLGRGRTARR